MKHTAKLRRIIFLILIPLFLAVVLLAALEAGPHILHDLAHAEAESGEELDVLARLFAKEWREEHKDILSYEGDFNDPNNLRLRPPAEAAIHAYAALEDKILSAHPLLPSEDVSEIARRTRLLLQPDMRDVAEKLKRICKTDIDQICERAFSTFGIGLEEKFYDARDGVRAVADLYKGTGGETGRIDAVDSLGEEGLEALNALLSEARARIFVQAYFERVSLEKAETLAEREGVRSKFTEALNQIQTQFEGSMPEEEDYFYAMFSLYYTLSKLILTPTGDVSEEADKLFSAEQKLLDEVQWTGEGDLLTQLFRAEGQFDAIVGRAEGKLGLLTYYEGLFERETMNARALSEAGISTLSETLADAYRAVDEAEGELDAAVWEGKLALFKALSGCLLRERFQTSYPAAPAELITLIEEGAQSIASLTDAEGTEEGLAALEGEAERRLEVTLAKVQVRAFRLELIRLHALDSQLSDAEQEAFAGLDGDLEHGVARGHLTLYAAFLKGRGAEVEEGLQAAYTALETAQDPLGFAFSAMLGLYRAAAYERVERAAEQIGDAGIVAQISDRFRGLAEGVLPAADAEGLFACEQIISEYAEKAEAKLAVEAYFEGLAASDEGVRAQLAAERDGAFSSIETASDGARAGWEGKLGLYKRLQICALDGAALRYGLSASELYTSYQTKIFAVSFADMVPANDTLAKLEGELDVLLSQGKMSLLYEKWYLALPQDQSLGEYRDAALGAIGSAEEGQEKLALEGALDLYEAYARKALDARLGQSGNEAALEAVSGVKQEIAALVSSAKATVTENTLEAALKDILAKLSGAELAVDRALATERLEAFLTALDARGNTADPAQAEEVEAKLAASEAPYFEVYKGMLGIYRTLLEGKGGEYHDVYEAAVAQLAASPTEAAAYEGLLSLYRAFGAFTVTAQPQETAGKRDAAEYLCGLIAGVTLPAEGECDARLAVAEREIDGLAAAAQAIFEVQEYYEGLAEELSKDSLPAFGESRISAFRKIATAEEKDAAKAEARSDLQAAQLDLARAEGANWKKEAGLKQGVDGVMAEDAPRIDAAKTSFAALSTGAKRALNAEADASGYQDFAELLSDMADKAAFEVEKAAALEFLRTYGGTGELLSRDRDAAYRRLEGIRFLAKPLRETKDGAAYTAERRATLETELEGAKTIVDIARGRQDVLDALERELGSLLNAGTYRYGTAEQEALKHAFDVAKEGIFALEEDADAGALAEEARAVYGRTPVDAVAKGMRTDGTGANENADPDVLCGIVESKNLPAGVVLDLRYGEADDDLMRTIRKRHISDGELVAVWEISLTVGEQKIVPTKPCTVKVLLPKTLREKGTLEIVHIGESPELLKVTREGNFLIFETQRFSAFYLYAERVVNLWWLVALLTLILVAQLAAILLLTRRRTYALGGALLTVILPQGAIVACAVLGVFNALAFAVLLYYFVRWRARTRRPERPKHRKEAEPAVVPKPVEEPTIVPVERPAAPVERPMRPIQVKVEPEPEPKPEPKPEPEPKPKPKPKPEPIIEEEQKPLIEEEQKPLIEEEQKPLFIEDGGTMSETMAEDVPEAVQVGLTETEEALAVSDALLEEIARAQEAQENEELARRAAQIAARSPAPAPFEEAVEEQPVPFQEVIEEQPVPFEEAVIEEPIPFEEAVEEELEAEVEEPPELPMEEEEPAMIEEPVIEEEPVIIEENPVIIEEPVIEEEPDPIPFEEESEPLIEEEPEPIPFGEEPEPLTEEEEPIASLSSYRAPEGGERTVIIEPFVPPEREEVRREPPLVVLNDLPEETLCGEVWVSEVNGLMGDETARRMIEESPRVAERRRTGIVNVDTLGEYFENGETVTLEQIKRRVPYFNERVTCVKILARGKLSKALIVEGDDFSLEAVKMIVLTGGRVLRTRTRK